MKRFIGTGICSIAHLTGYCATKAGLHSFTESLRVQLKNTKVKVF